MNNRRCPKCQALLKLPDSVRGRRVQCPTCKTILRVTQEFEVIESASVEKSKNGDDLPAQTPPQKPYDQWGINPAIAPPTTTVEQSTPATSVAPKVDEPRPTMNNSVNVTVDVHQAAPAAHTTIIMMNQKSVIGAFLLALFFGPLGMIYGTVVGAIVIFCLDFLIFFGTFGLGLPLIFLTTYPIGVFWATLAAHMHNQRAFSLNPHGREPWATWVVISLCALPAVFFLLLGAIMLNALRAPLVKTDIRFDTGPIPPPSPPVIRKEIPITKEQPKKPQRSALPPGALLVEHFDTDDLVEGGLPKGWFGSFSISRDPANQKMGVIVNEGRKAELKLPPLNIEGDFSVEIDFAIAYSLFASIQLESLGGPTIKATIDSHGDLYFNDSPKQEVGAMNSGKLRIEREGFVYKAIVNGKVIIGTTIKNDAPFQTIRLGLASRASFGNAQIYSVEVYAKGKQTGITKKTNDSNPPMTISNPIPSESIPTQEGIFDFRHMTLGTLPPGWVPSNLNNFAVRQVGELRALALLNLASGDKVLLPTFVLKDDFLIECEFEIPERESFVTLELEGKSTEKLKLDLRGDGTCFVQDKARGNASRLFKVGQMQRLRLKRTANDYTLELNDASLGKLPISFGTPDFKIIRLGLGLSSKRRSEQSPRVYSIKISPPA